MDEQTLNAIADFKFEEDMRRAEERALSPGFMERDSDGRLILTYEEKQFWARFYSSDLTLHEARLPCPRRFPLGPVDALQWRA